MKNSDPFPFAWPAVGNISAYLAVCGEINIFMVNLRFMEMVNL